ncbi:MAG: hypothetical protein V9G10_17150 [Candidatus Nanopelagicales bacterium]
MTARRIALVMAVAFAVYAVLVAWRGWDFIASGRSGGDRAGTGGADPAAAGRVAGVAGGAASASACRSWGPGSPSADERPLEERIARAQADPDDWRAWYWAGVGSAGVRRTRSRRGRRWIMHGTCGTPDRAGAAAQTAPGMP